MTPHAIRRAVSAIVVALLLIPAWTSFDRARLTFRQFSKLRARGGAAPDTNWDRYYARLVFLMPERGRIGLVQSLPPGVARAREAYMLQYALTPRVLVPDTDVEFVIACGPASAWPALVDTSRFVEVRRFENDFALFRRVKP